jgi:putative transposase
MNNQKPYGMNIGDTCYWFSNDVSTFSKKLFFPSTNNLNLLINKDQNTFISKSADISNNIHLDFKNEKPIIIEHTLNKYEKKIIKNISKIINSDIKYISKLKSSVCSLFNFSKKHNKFCFKKKYKLNVFEDIIIAASKEPKNNNDNDNKIIDICLTYKPSNFVIRSHKYEILLFKDKHEIITNWIKICNHFYNYLVYKYNEFLKNPVKDSIYSFNKPYANIKKIIFNEYFTNVLVSSNADVIEQQININSLKISKNPLKKKKPIPYDMITDELRIFCSNLKSCKSNLDNKNIKDFEIKKQEYNRKNRSILLPKKYIVSDGILVNTLGRQNNFNYNIKQLIKKDKIRSDCRLVYDYTRKKIFCIIPLEKEKQAKVKTEQYVAFDPGVKIFQTYYGEKSCGTIGENIGNEKHRGEQKIAEYEKILTDGINRYGKKLKNKKRIREKINNVVRKYNNKITDMQNKAANKICNKWERILYPSFRVSTMVNNTTGNIGKATKRNLLSMRHYRFKQHIIHKSEEYGCKIKIVEEDYTSMCCGNCGKLSKNYVDRMKECPYCKIKINRDVNGAFNILIKNHKEL